MKLLKRPKKSLGQNFLIDQNIIKKIIKIENISDNSIILEIGAGSGNLTKKIEEAKPKKIFAVEKDTNLSQSLENDLKNFKNIKVINDDIFNIIREKKLGDNIIVFGNLPYNISTKILAELILINPWPPWYKSLILMFQKEVADRIIAKTKTKTFGRLSVLCNWRLEVKKHFDVSKNCFLPKPNVDSTVLSFKPKKKYGYNIKNPKNLEIVTRILFSNRRKMINKNFKKLFKSKNSIAKDLDLNLRLRPEELSCDMFYKIAMIYENLLN
tara:strand:- start:315 stop:1121 length:807 start_codon:yes stop_codon:yes gene_type:complete